MRSSAPRRVLAALFAVAAVFAWAVPAQAAAKARVDFFVKSYTLAPGDGALIYTRLFADRTLPVARGAVSIVYRFVGQGPSFHLQEAGHPNNCSVDIATLLELRCGAEVSSLNPAGVDSAVVGYVQAAANAVPGQVATLTATMTVKGYAPVTRTARIQIGEPINLTAPETDLDRSVPPGGSFDVPLTITNAGTVAARGAAIGAYTQYAYESRTQYSNCFYVGAELRGCTFDQTLEPGASYRLNLPFRMRKDTEAPSAQYGSWQWSTLAEFADARQFVLKGGFQPLGSPGRGGVLRLTRVATLRAQADPPQALGAYVQQGLKVTVTGKQTTDLAAVGDTASGKKGAVVTVSVGLRNAGPAALDRSRVNPGWPNTRVYIPKGTTAVRVPTLCLPMTSGGAVDENRAGAPGELRYSCRFFDLLKVGGTTTLDFGLRIDRVITGARGAAAVGAPADERNKANNTAAIVINPAAASPAPGGQGGGGGLPITGPQGGVLGLALVAVGALALLLTRRNRI